MIPPRNGGGVAGRCEIVVEVTSVIAGTGNNQLPAASVTGTYEGSAVSNPDTAQQSLSFLALPAPGISKGFSSSTIVKADQPTRLTITIANNAPQPLPLNDAGDNPPFAIRDRLGDFGLRVAPSPDVQINCGATPPSFSPAADDTTISAVGGVIAANSTCQISVMVVADGVNNAYSTSVNNVINRTSDFANKRGLVPAQNASASLTVTAPLRVEKGFTPATVAAGQEATLQIRLTNASPLSVMDIGAFADDIDGPDNGLQITSAPSFNCTGGSVINGLTGQGGQVLSFTSATLQPNSNCLITVPYTAALDVPGTPQTFTNTIPAGGIAVTSPADVFSQQAVATVTVADQFSVEKSSSPTIVAPGNPVRFDVQVRNFSIQPQTVTVTDNLPAGMQLLDAPSHPAPSLSGSGCSGLVVAGSSAVPTFTFDMPAGTAGASANCSVRFWAMVPEGAAAGATITNSLAGGDVCAGGICSHVGSSAGFDVASSTLAVEKIFDQATKPEGTPATMTLSLVNLSAQPLSNVSLLDALPLGSNGTQMRVASPSNASTTCGGVINALPGSDQVQLSGATVPARAGSGLGAAGRCTLTVNVTGAAGAYINSLPQGAASGTETLADGTTRAVQSPGPVNRSIDFLSALSGSKSFLPNQIQSGGRSTVTIRLTNTQPGVLDNVSVTDNLPAGMLVATPANAYSTCAGAPVINAAPGASTVSLTGAQLATGSCDLLFDVTASGGGNWVNTIGAGQLNAAGGVQNVTPFGATLQNASGGAITVGINHATASIAAPGATTQLTLSLFNNGTLDLSGLDLASYFTDTGLADGSPTGERIASVANASTDCPGGIVSAPAGGTSLSLAGASLAAGLGCSVTVDVTMVTTGTVTATIPASSISTDQGVTNADPALSSLQTSSGLGVIKQFTPNVVLPNERSRLRITFYNPTPQAISNLAVVDSFPAGLTAAAPANAVNTCQASLTNTPTQVSLSGGQIAAGTGSEPATCYLEIDVLSATQGDYLNLIAAGEVSGEAGGSSVTNNEPTSDTLRVKSPLLVHKAIVDLTLDAGNPLSFTTGTAQGSAGTPYTLSVRIRNPNDTVLNGLSFTDNLPSGLVIAQTPAVSNSCGGSVNVIPSGTSLRLSGGVLAANSDCTVSVDVLSNVAGSYTNTIASGDVTTTEGVSNDEPTRARIVISTAPTVSKQFEPGVIAQNGISRLTIFVNNPNESAMTLTAAMTDTLPVSPGPVTVAANPNTGGTCPLPAITANPGGAFVRLANGTVVPPQGCTIEVDVTAAVPGEHTNVIAAGALQTTLGNNPQPAFAPLSVSTLGYISGRVYLDNNLTDGAAFVPGIDSPLAGVIIELRAGADCSAPLVGGIAGLLNPTQTTAAGNYLFSGLPAGVYSVCQPDQPNGTLNGLPVAGTIVSLNGSGGVPGNAGNPVSASPASQITAIELQANGVGEVSGSVANNFPEVRPSSLSGSVFLDQNNDGIRQGGESGLPGVVIELQGTDWLGQPVSRNTLTDGSGNYSFAALPPGTFTVTEPNQPVGTANGITTAGSTGGSVTAVGVTPSRISGIDLPPATDSVGNNFAEIGTGRSIYGRVFHDRDVDGVPSSGDVGLGGQSIVLTGVDINGNTISQSTLTASDGSFFFIGLPPGVYELTQPNQPASLLNGTTTAGSAGGNATAENVVPSTISTIDLTATAISVDNWFAEVSIPSLSGRVWFDTNHDRVYDPGEPLMPGWRVELWRAGSPYRETTTDANGFYQFSDLEPGNGYEVRFRHPESGTYFGRPVPNERGDSYVVGAPGPGNPAGADNSNGILAGITIPVGRDIPEQSLPLDPAGVVYDAISRQPVRGAVVSISGPAGFSAADVLGGSTEQTTGNDGFYQFLLLGTAPAGTYTLTVTAPAGYLPAPSQLIPACTNTLATAALPDPALVQNSNQAPLEAIPLHDPLSCPVNTAGLAGGAGTTQYYFSFDLSALSADVLNNHIPLDPVMGGAIVMTKVTPKVNVTRGELVPYTLTARNTLATTLSNIVIEDQIPPGFKYVKGSAQIEGVPVEPEVQGRLLRWPERSINGGQSVIVKLLLVVGSGVGFNDYVNQTWASSLLAGSRVSNVATATVRVVPDPTFDCSDIIGKVYDDQNRNGYQDEGEPGLPGVRLATPRGWLVTTDEHGRFHVACADVPSELRGANFILKVDERTLPSGYRITTENPRVVRVTQGRMVKANFGASIHRVVRLDLNSEAFTADHQLVATYQARLQEVLTLLYAEPSILRIAYRMPVESKVNDARKRIGHVRDWVKDQWQPQECCYDLQIEEEIVPASDSVEVIR